MKVSKHLQNILLGRSPLIIIIVSTLIVIAISLYCLSEGWFIVFQNLFYVPIIISCMFYTKRGFIFSVLLSFIYFLLIIAFTRDSLIIVEAVARLFIFIAIAGVLTFISIKLNKVKVMLQQANDELEQKISNRTNELRRVNQELQNEIKARTQIQQEIENRNLVLAKQNADKEQFISILSHDLKSPFNSILGFLNLLTQNIRNYDIDKIERQINIVNDSAKSTFNLLEDILMWIRANSGKIPYEPQNLNLTTICNEVVEKISITAQAKEITINYSKTDNNIVFADINMLKTVLRNLISNAIKFSNKGGKIRILAKKNPSDTQITVSDNGVGIEDDEQTKLFEISQSISNKGTMGEKGTGLGLKLCKELIERHKGKIWVESKVGKGSNFIFTLPNEN